MVENTKQFHIIYVPPFLKKGKFLFFAVDNTDFAEDTPDGKGTTHGTITAIYQRADTSREPIAPPLHFQDTKANSLSMTPHHKSIMPCEKPKATPNKYTREFTINNFAVSASSCFTTWMGHRVNALQNRGWWFKSNSWLGWLPLLAVNMQAVD